MIATSVPVLSAPLPTNARQALTSSASAEWGTPETLRRFAASVLKPAARGGTAIDADGASSAYWHAQWSAGDRPSIYFDGSPGRDARSIEDWTAEIASKGPIGSFFENPPGDPTGDTVKDCWRAIEHLHTNQEIDSAVWIGFSFEQLRSLIPNGDPADDLKHPLHPALCTVFPSRRVSYMTHP
jgi:hypothetical protein